MKPTLTPIRTYEYGHGAGSDHVEVYAVSAKMAKGLAILAEGEDLNGDSKYAVCEVYQENGRWMAEFVIEAEFMAEEWGEESFAGMIQADVTNALGIDPNTNINWRACNRIS